MTSTCKYRKRGKVCRKRATLTLIGYGLNTTMRSFKSVMGDVSIRNSWSYCDECAKLIDKRCMRTHFVDDNGAPIDIKTGARTDLPRRA